MKTTRIVLGIIGLLLVGGLVVFMQRQPASGQSKAGAAGSSSAGAGDRAVPVATAVATKKDVPVLIEGLGTVTPLYTVTVKSQVDGRLDRVLFKEGEDVKKGQVIAVIDPRPFEIQLHQGEAALYRDESQVKNNQLNLDRYTQLRQGNLVPQQQVDDQKTQVDQYDAAARADKATIEAAKLNLDYANIKSPIDGVTGIRQVDPGNIIHQVDTTGIVVITQIDPIAVLFTIPQDDLPRVQKALMAGKVSVDVFGRDGSNKMANGELMLIDNQVNAQTATIRLKAVFPNPTKSLWPQAFVKARVQVEMLKGALVVPASVVQRGPNGTFAYVMGADKTVQPRNIEVGSIEGDQAVINKGINEGEIVIADGQNQLKPGGKVAPRGKDKDAAQGATGAYPAGSASARP